MFQHKASVFLLITALTFAGAMKADDEDELTGPYRHGGSCTRAAIAVLRSCRFEKSGDAWLERGKCNNIADTTKRDKCEAKAIVAIEEGDEECNAQLEARLALCKVLGDESHEPKFSPAMFVKPADIGKGVQPNPFFPLVAGRTYIYQGGGETITYAVTRETQDILGVACTVIHDVVTKDGEVIEDTTDWYAQDTKGNVWYFGEVAQNFQDGFLANLDGSWIAGVDGAQPGLIMKAQPAVGNIYRQEFYLGSAEDMSEVTSVTGSTQTPANSCSGTCLVTRDFTPVEPGINTLKYYAPGIGLIAEENAITKVRKQLVEIKQ